MTIYVVKQGRGDRRYEGSDDYDGELFHTDWDVKVFDCLSKVIDYIYDAINAEVDRIEDAKDSYYTRRLSREKIESYQEGQPIRYATALAYDHVEEEHYFTYQSYEVE
jgi:hypothetical protein